MMILFNNVKQDEKFTTYGGGPDTVFQKQNIFGAQELDAEGKPVRTWHFPPLEVVTITGA